MDTNSVVKYRGIFKIAYYLISLLCFAVSGVALYYACPYLDIQWYLWVLIVFSAITYTVCALLLASKTRGYVKLAFHTFAMQIVPICVAAWTLYSAFKPVEHSPLTGKPRTYERHFRDMQNKQKAIATVIGLPPFKSRKEVEAKYNKLYRDDKLVQISTNSRYVVRHLNYSSPYVIPKVEALLDDIAEGFQKKTESRSKFVVTSVLRTLEDVEKLKKVNGNASAASCHCNATTIDISYVRFAKDPWRQRDDYELRLALAQTLYELREAGRCYVKFESKQHCYHITVR